MHDRFRAAGAASRQELVAVALQQTDAVERNAEPVGEHLREWRRMSLPVIERASDDGAVGFEADAAHFLAGRGGDLEKVSDAEPAHLSAFAALAFAAREALHVRHFERVLEQARKIAAVVMAAGSRLDWNLARLDLVAPAQLKPIDAYLGVGRVDQPLHVIIALGPAGAAVGGDVRRVGEYALGRDLDQWRAVDVLHILDDVDRRGH